MKGGPSVATPTPSAPARPARTRPDRFRPLGFDLAHSEWTKLRTVRSTYWTLLVTAIGMVAFGALLTTAYVRHYSSAGPAARAAFDPAAYSLSGFFLAQLAVGVLGVVVMTSEYQTGSIRATFAAAPQRPMVLAAKAAVFGAVAAVTGIISSAAAFFTGQAILSAKGIQAHIGDPGALRSVIGAGLYLAVLGLVALGLATLIRRSAGAIAAVVGLVLVCPSSCRACHRHGRPPPPGTCHRPPARPSSAAPSSRRWATCSPRGPASRCSAPTPPRHSRQPPSC